MPFLPVSIFSDILLVYQNVYHWITVNNEDSTFQSKSKVLFGDYYRIFLALNLKTT